MIVPMFKEDYQNKSLKELIKDRQKVMEEIIRIEKEDFCINSKPASTGKPFKPKMMMSPSPDTVWTVLNMDLKMLNGLIEEHNIEKEIIIDLENGNE